MILAILLSLVGTAMPNKIWRCTNTETHTQFYLTYRQTGSQIRDFEVGVAGAPESYQRWSAIFDHQRIVVQSPKIPEAFRWMELNLNGVTSKPNFVFGTTNGAWALDNNEAICREDHFDQTAQ